jgi:hypothetical protein
MDAYNYAIMYMDPSKIFHYHRHWLLYLMHQILIIDWKLEVCTYEKLGGVHLHLKVSECSYA